MQSSRFCKLYESEPDEFNKTTGTLNWIFTLTLRYFTLLERSCFGRYFIL